MTKNDQKGKNQFSLLLSSFITFTVSSSEHVQVTWKTYARIGNEGFDSLLVKYRKPGAAGQPTAQGLLSALGHVSASVASIFLGDSWVGISSKTSLCFAGTRVWVSLLSQLLSSTYFFASHIFKMISVPRLGQGGRNTVPSPLSSFQLLSHRCQHLLVNKLTHWYFFKLWTKIRTPGTIPGKYWGHTQNSVWFKLYFIRKTLNTCNDSMTQRISFLHNAGMITLSPCGRIIQQSHQSQSEEN